LYDFYFSENMTLYDQTKMIELEHTTAVQSSITSETGIRDGSPSFVEAPLK